jgi:hypothetical protein
MDQIRFFQQLWELRAFVNQVLGILIGVDPGHA